MILTLIIVAELLSCVTSQPIHHTFKSSELSQTYCTHKEVEARTPIECCIKCSMDGNCIASVWNYFVNSKLCNLLLTVQDQPSQVFNTSDGQTVLTKLGCPSDFTKTGDWCLFVGDAEHSWSDAENICQSYGSHVHLADVNNQQVTIFPKFQPN